MFILIINVLLVIYVSIIDNNSSKLFDFIVIVFRLYYTNKVEVEAMIYCIIISGIIAFLSIFAFCGKAVIASGKTIIPTMFNLMFGGTENIKYYVIQWTRYDLLTFLFVLQIIIMIVAILSFIICYNLDTDYKAHTHILIISVIEIILCVTASIISLLTFEITGVNVGNNLDIRLGPGPIAYTTMNMVAVAFLIVGNILNLVNPTYRYYNIEAYKSQLKQNHGLSESVKVDLIIKYKNMLDDGIITKEEFEQKKKDLL